MASKLSPALASLASAFRNTRPATSTTCRLQSQLQSTLPASASASATSAAAASITRRVNDSAALGRSGTTRSFSTSTSLAARKKDQNNRVDRRITLIRYFLYHPLTPSPLRFSRNRFLRHWTIHRAWQLHLGKQRAAHKRELQRQYEAMKAANEELRTGAGDGGWLFKMAMSKHRLYKEPVPIEYGRLQTETPSKSGWNYEWKREVDSSL